jgi:hypothetical protein
MTLVFHIKNSIKLINEMVHGRKSPGLMAENVTGFDHLENSKEVSTYKMSIRRTVPLAAFRFLS